MGCGSSAAGNREEVLNFGAGGDKVPEMIDRSRARGGSDRWRGGTCESVDLWQFIPGQEVALPLLSNG